MMSLKHSPPKFNTKSPHRPNEAPTSALHPSTAKLPPQSTVGVENITLRSKNLRKDKESDDDERSEVLLSLATLQEMFTSFSSQQDARFSQMMASIAAVEAQNEEISKSVAFMSEHYDKLLEKVNILEAEKKEDQRQIKLLEERVDSLERMAKSAALEIRNIPVTSTNSQKHDSKNDLCKIIKNLGNAISVDIADSDIKNVFRANGKKESSPPIIVEFCTVLKKESIMEALKKFNKGKQNSEKLNSCHLDPTKPKIPIFLSESLTLKTQHLFYQARLFAKENGYAFCWVSHGTVFLRRAEKMPQIKINSEATLANLKITA